MEKSKNTVTIAGSGEGSALSIAGGSYRIVISGRETEGAYAVIEMLVPPGGGPGPHAHADIQESFFVLEGEVEIKTENGTYTAGKGSFANIPLGGLVHGFKNKKNEVARLWCTVVPAGLEDFFLEIGRPISFGTFVPAAPPDPETMKKIQMIAEKHGQKLYPPDYLD